MPATPVADSAGLLPALRQASRGGTALIGFDFPIGLPRAYAHRAGIRHFPTALPLFGSGQWADFFAVASRPEEISIRRPFYPYAPGGTNRRQLSDALRFESPDDLYRQCERGTADRVTASCLFWTLGAKQAGRAAIAGWQEVLQPAIRRFGTELGLWPFDGTLSDLLASRPLVVCEAYPTNAHALLGLNGVTKRWSKRRPSDRRARASILLAWTRERSIKVHPQLARQIRDGFGEGADGEDAFDSTLGLLSMLAVVQNPATEKIPLAPRDLAVEGWML